MEVQQTWKQKTEIEKSKIPSEIHTHSRQQAICGLLFFLSGTCDFNKEGSLATLEFRTLCQQDTQAAFGEEVEVSVF